MILNTDDSSQTSALTPPQSQLRPALSRQNDKLSISSRKMLLHLIAKEIESSMQNGGLFEEDLNHANLPEGATQSAEDIFYARVNGEEIDLEGFDSQKCFTNFDLEEDDISDQGSSCSFAGMDITRDDSKKLTSPRTKMTATTTQLSPVSSASRGSSRSTGMSGLSLDEIERYVKKHMAPEVKATIPKDAWKQIFGKGSDQTNKLLRPSLDQIAIESDQSAISEMTQTTIAPQHSTHKVSNRSTGRNSTVGIAASPLLLPTIQSIRKSAAQAKVLQRTGVTVQTKKSKTLVKFDSVHVRYYERILDINPAVTSGAAIGLGWKFRGGGVIPVDTWESRKGGRQLTSDDLLMTRPMREAMLKALGYSQPEIAQATRSIRKAKKLRTITITNLGVQPVQEAVENASRLVKGILSLGQKKGLVKRQTTSR